MTLPKNADCIIAWTEEVADGEYEHYVAVADMDGEPLSKSLTWVCWEAEDADDLAFRMADKYHLEYVSSDLKMW